MKGLFITRVIKEVARKVNSFHRVQCGLTLVELLVTLSLLAVLVGICTPVVSHLRADNGTDAAAIERLNIQLAVDYLMMDQNIIELPNPVTVPTSDMTAFPDWENAENGGYVLHPDVVYKNSDDDKFVREYNTKGTYICTADGTVTQTSWSE